MYKPESLRVNAIHNFLKDFGIQMYQLISTRKPENQKITCHLVDITFLVEQR